MKAPQSAREQQLDHGCRLRLLCRNPETREFQTRGTSDQCRLCGKFKRIEEINKRYFIV